MRKSNLALARSGKWICRFARKIDGATEIEYVFLVALIGLAVITSYTGFAAEMNQLWDFINSSFVDPG